MPVAVCYFYVWSCCKKSLAPRFGARRQRRKRRRSACGTSHSVLDPPVACFWGVIRWSNPWGPRWSCWAKNLINILNIYSAIIVVIILSLICANLYSQNTFQERQREKQTCVFFQSLRTSKYPESSTWCHSTTWGADQEIAVWSRRSQGGLSFRRLRSGWAWNVTPHFFRGWKWWGLGCQWYQPFNMDVQALCLMK